ncbi:MAG TPA: NUDIX hydrolase [Rhodothermales bacterium]|nr:NUDIX hydrolase [Rhodothermales bacterium]
MLRFVSIARALLVQPTRALLVRMDTIRSELEAARIDSDDAAILVYDAALIPDDGPDHVKLVIAESRNGVPYRPPFSVTAAGGYILRSSPAKGGQGREVLLIFRRGVWDLPKGKLNKNESIETAALREVEEEVGAANLRVISPLGTTMHGYPEGKRYAVKTTHWFLMETTSVSFTPQLTEQIEAARWVAWDQAREMLGFDTLREHMASINLGP